jgi:molecular chaperone Hsp33
MDNVYKFYTEDLAVRASFVYSTAICQEVVRRQGTDPLATIAMGRLLTGTILMASQLWENQSLSVRLEGDGPLGHLYAECSFEGNARCYVSNPQIAAGSLPPEKLNLKSAIGEGILVVSRNLPFQKQPQSGIVPIVSGEISQDLAFYLQQSHQIPSVVSLTVTLDERGQIKLAGGVLLELIPGAPDSIINILEERARETIPLSRQLLEEASPETIVQGYVHQSRLKSVEHSHPIKFTCRCNQERVEKTLSLMGKATLSEMILKGEEVKAKCEFCGQHYSVGVERLREILHSKED